VITDEQRQEFYDAIEYDEDKAAIAESIEIPKDVSSLLSWWWSHCTKKRFI
jgi:vacuolar protein sorting-associated protein 13A/C